MDIQQLRLLRLDEVRSITGLSRSTIYSLSAAGTFPKAVRIGGSRVVCWLQSEVNNFIEQQVAARDNSQSQQNEVGAL